LTKSNQYVVAICVTTICIQNSFCPGTLAHIFFQVALQKGFTKRLGNVAAVLLDLVGLSFFCFFI